MAWSAAEHAALFEILHDRTRWPLLECQGEGADAVFKDAEVRAPLGKLQRQSLRTGLPEHKCPCMHTCAEAVFKDAEVRAPLGKLQRQSLRTGLPEHKCPCMHTCAEATRV